MNGDVMRCGDDLVSWIVSMTASMISDSGWMNVWHTYQNYEIMVGDDDRDLANEIYGVMNVGCEWQGMHAVESGVTMEDGIGLVDASLMVSADGSLTVFCDDCWKWCGWV